MRRRLRRRSRKVTTRIALRILARRNPENREEIQKILDDQDMLDMVVEEASQRYSEVMQVSDGGGGPLLNFLDWLLNNGPALLEFILKLIGMFGV